MKWLVIIPYYKEPLTPFAGICTPTKLPCRRVGVLAMEKMLQDLGILAYLADTFLILALSFVRWSASRGLDGITSA